MARKIARSSKSTLVLFMILGGISAPLYLNHIFGEFHFLWKHEEIYADLENISEILYVDYFDTLTPNTFQDRLLMKAENGDIYLLSQKQWLKIDALPVNSQNISFTEQSNDIYLITEQKEIYKLIKPKWILTQKSYEEITFSNESSPCSPWHLNPRGKKEILSSNGRTFERPLALTFRCYTVYKNGSILIWTRILTLFTIFGVPISVVLGIFLGALIDYIFYKFRLYQTSRISHKTLQ